MAMGGGTFITQNKVLPGAYINVVGTAGASVDGVSGIMTMPIVHPWGPEGTIITMNAEDFAATALSVLGYDATDASLLLVREALKRASKVLLCRVNVGGVKASATIGGILCTAKWTGLRGNALKVAVQTNIENGSYFDVITYIGTTVVDKQTVLASTGLVANSWVTFGTGTLAVAAATSLSGGTDGTANGTSYSAYLTAVEVYDFNTICFPGTDSTTKALIVAFVQRLRDTNGLKIVGVLYGQTADYEGIINVKNGVILSDGTTITGDKAVAWVAGAAAAAGVNESLTNAAYDGAVDVNIRYTRSQYEAAIAAGEFAFYGDNGKARVLADVNSLTSLTTTKTAALQSNRVMRVLDSWATRVAAIFNTMYLGQQTNNATGRDLFKADLVSLADEYTQLGAISDFDPADVTISQGTGKKDVTVTVALTPNDSMEKLYMTCVVA